MGSTSAAMEWERRAAEEARKNAYRRGFAAAREKIETQIRIHENALASALKCDCEADRKAARSLERALTSLRATLASLSSLDKEGKQNAR